MLDSYPKGKEILVHDALAKRLDPAIIVEDPSLRYKENEVPDKYVYLEAGKRRKCIYVRLLGSNIDILVRENKIWDK